MKLDSQALEGLPAPRPWVEIWVCAPTVEGVHLRGGAVARGGLRWSDRREDFRTEVLGLMKAQMVKNAVIVPVGSKGGFVVKRPPADRAARQAAGVAAYQTFIRGLLDLTDNWVDGAAVTPPRTLRHDDDDPYLVVAADKGTASFSDIANAVADIDASLRSLHLEACDLSVPPSLRPAVPPTHWWWFIRPPVYVSGGCPYPDLRDPPPPVAEPVGATGATVQQVAAALGGGGGA